MQIHLWNSFQILLFPVSGRHIGILGCDGIVGMTPFHRQNIFEKSRQSIHLNSDRFRNSSQKIGLGPGGIFYPLCTTLGLTHVKDANQSSVK